MSQIIPLELVVVFGTGLTRLLRADDSSTSEARTASLSSVVNGEALLRDAADPPGILASIGK
jgi:hypothetical protein